jgi:hypothetical protein
MAKRSVLEIFGGRRKKKQPLAGRVARARRFENLEDRLLLAEVNLLAVKDNTLFQHPAGALSSGAGEFLYAGQTISVGSRRAVVAFDATEIPAGSTVTDVSMRLRVSKAARNTNNTAPFTIHKLTTDWGEGTSNAGSPGGRGVPATLGDATWIHTHFSSATWTNEGGDFVVAPSATADVGGKRTFANWSSTEMAADVQAWVNDSGSNFGWIIIGDESTFPSARGFDSRDKFGTLQDKPVLVVTYEPAAAEALSLSITDGSISESGGTTTATVSRTTTTGDLTVDLSSDDVSEATVPASIVISNGQATSASFTITAIDDALLDGTQTVTISATAAGVDGVADTIDITDHEPLTLSIVDSSISESGGTTTATVTRTDPTGDLTVQLLSSDTSAATVVASVVIPAGDTMSAAFSINAVDDSLLDGTQAVTISADATGYESAAALVDVTDFEQLLLTTELSSISENGGTTAGTVTRTDSAGALTVTLLSSDASEATVSALVTIPDGIRSADFSVIAVDDLIGDGDQTVTLTATAAGYVDGTNTVNVTDDETSVVLNPSKDNTLFSRDQGDRSSGQGHSLFVGINSNATLIRRALLAFNVLDAGIPAGSTILSASLEMFVDRAGSETSAAVSLHRVSQDWGEGPSGSGGNGGGGGAAAQPGDATWLHTFFDTAFWTTPGGDFDAAPTATTDVGLVGTTATWSSTELTSDVQNWLNDPSANFGWIVIGKETTPSATKRFPSRESATGPQPILRVVYAAPTEQLTLAIDPDSISENGGATQATLTRTGDLGGDLTVALSNSDAGEVSTPASVTILDGSPTATFLITGVDDDLLDGTQSVTIHAAATGFSPADGSVNVSDFEQLTVSIDAQSISEADGATTAMVTRLNSSGELIVNLQSDDTTEAVVPLTVVIADGETESPPFTIDAVDDAIVDGTQTVAITGAADGYVTGAQLLDVNDFEQLGLTLADNSIAENGGSTAGIVTRTDSTGDLTITLSSSDTSEATVPASLTIPAGELTASFTVTAVDDQDDDGNQAVTLHAAAVGYEANEASVSVTDDEVASVTLMPVIDNTLFEDATGATSNGKGEFLFTGRTNGGAIRRAALAFDLSAAGIPAGSRIISVRLEATVSQSSSAGAEMVSLHRILNAWGEGDSDAPGQEGSGTAAELGDATWLHRFFDTEPWTNEGGDFAQTSRASVDVGGVGTIASWSSAGLVDDVQSWLDTPAGNFGWAMVGNETTARTSKRFDSRDSDGGSPPRLTITFSNPDESLQLELAQQSVSENGGSTQATLSRTGPTDAALTVALTSSDTSEASVPDSVTIESGQSTAIFTVAANDDVLLDGTQAVLLGAQAIGFTPGEALLEITDFEALTLVIDADAIPENGGSTSAVVSRTFMTGELVVTLASGDIGEATVAGLVTISDGQAQSAPFTIDAVDDDLLDGTQSVNITATADGFQPATDTFDVTDDEIAAPTSANIEAGVLTVTGSGLDDTLSLRVDGSDLVLSDPANQISVGAGAGAHEVAVPLADFPNGLAIDLQNGANSLTLDPTVDNAIAELLSLTGGLTSDTLFVQGTGITLDLSRLMAVEHVDISGGGSNSLGLELSSVLQNASQDTNQVTVISDLGDTVTIGEGWSLSRTTFDENSLFYRVLAQGGVELRLSGPAHWQNPVANNDVSGDGVISPVGDVLSMINEINSPTILNGANEFPQPTPVQFPVAFLDVNGDGTLSPVGDILPVINFLNSGGDGEGEGVVRMRNAERGVRSERLAFSSLRTPHSAFRTPHSAFRTPHSPLRTPHSPLRIPHSAFPTPNSAFGELEELLDALAPPGGSELAGERYLDALDQLFECGIRSAECGVNGASG